MSTITTGEADDILYSDARLATQEVSRHRWYTRRLIVFESPEFEGPMGFYYLDPATEEQDGQDLYEDDPVPIFPVVSREVVTTVYEPA